MSWYLYEILWLLAILILVGLLIKNCYFWWQEYSYRVFKKDTASIDESSSDDAGYVSFWPSWADLYDDEAPHRWMPTNQEDIEDIFTSDITASLHQELRSHKGFTYVNDDEIIWWINDLSEVKVEVRGRIFVLDNSLEWNEVL